LTFDSPQSFIGLFRTKLPFTSFYYELLILELKVLQKLTSETLQIHIAKHRIMAIASRGEFKMIFFMVYS